MRKTLTLLAASGLVLGPVTAAHAAPRGCQGPIITSSTVVTDRGEIGVLDSGDVFTLRFRQPIGNVDAPSFAIVLEGANGQGGYLSHPGGSFEYTQTARSVTITINETEISGTPNEFSVPMPASITYINGIYSKNDRRQDAQVSIACSKDLVVS